MKLFLLILLVVVVLGGVLGTLLVEDPGYILINYGQYAVETSLWVGLLLLLAVYLLIRSVAWLFRSFVATQNGLVRWRSSRALRQARGQTVRGLLMLAEGRWTEAEKLLLDAAQRMETPLVNYLNAARAAHERADYVRRDQHLQLAHETTPGAKFAVTLTQAEFGIEQAHYEQAIAALLVLRKRAPKHPAVLNMLATCYAKLPDAQCLLELLPELRKFKTQPEPSIAELENQAWRMHLPLAQDVRRTWKDMPEQIKTEPNAMVVWVDGLVERQLIPQAEQAVKLVLGKVWVPQLVEIYGKLNGPEPAKQLQVAQSWFKERSEDAQLLLTLGRLSLMVENFGQAREYFESSLRLQATPDVYGELGRLLLAQGDEKRGMAYLLSAQSGLPDLPQPETEMISKVGVS